MELKPVPKTPRPDKTTISLRLDKESYERLQAEAERIGITLSEAVRQIIKQFLDKLT